MSMDHYENLILYEIDGSPIKTYKKMCLGHETNLSRFVLFDMLIQGYISKDDIIVTLKDRKFLYTQIFPNCIDSDSYKQIPNIQDYHIINLWKITGSEMHINRSAIYNEFNHTMLERVDFPEMKKLLNSIDYCPIDNLLENIDCGIISVGHNWNGKEAIELEKKVLTFFGFNVIDNLCWSYQWTNDYKDESLKGYKNDSKDFKKIIVDLFKKILKFKDFK